MHNDNQYIIINNKEFHKELSKVYQSKIDEASSSLFLPKLDDGYFYYVNNKNICQ